MKRVNILLLLLMLFGVYITHAQGQNREYSISETAGSFYYYVNDEDNHYVTISTKDATKNSIGYYNIINLDDTCTLKGNVVIPSTFTDNGVTYTVTKIGLRAFAGKEAITSITLPNTVTSIEKFAFRLMKNIESIDIGASIVNIGDSAFAGARGFNSLILPNTLTTIGLYAFAYTDIEILNIPKSVTQINNPIAVRSYNLKSINVETENENYKSINGILYNKACTIALECPKNIQLTEINIPNTVTTFAYNSFSDLKQNNIVKKINIPEGVLHLDTLAFYRYSFDTLILPSTILTAKRWSLYSEGGIIVFQNETPISLVDNPLNTIKEIYVPCAKLDDYKTAWASYASKIYPNRTGGSVEEDITDNVYLSEEDCNCKKFPEVINIKNNASLSFGNYTTVSSELSSSSVKLEKTLPVSAWALLGNLSSARTYGFLDGNKGTTTGSAHGMAAFPFDYSNNTWGDAALREQTSPSIGESFYVYPVKKEIDKDNSSEDLADE
ncbi:MAG: leucine-rich repeat protein, partial [Bacteroidales bacterium]|nr:leucine-rich repeat protein [Bacteroidales bacterium]